MTVEKHFLDIASERLAPDTFALLLAAAHARTEPQPGAALPKRQRIEKPFLQERIGQALAGTGTASSSQVPDQRERLPQTGSHVAVRLEQRMQIAATPSELGELARLVKHGGINVRTLRTQMQTILHCEVRWRDRDFVVVYNKSRDELITAYAFRPTSPTKPSKVRFPGEKARVKVSWRDIGMEDDDE